MAWRLRLFTIGYTQLKKNGFLYKGNPPLLPGASSNRTAAWVRNNEQREYKLNNRKVTKPLSTKATKRSLKRNKWNHAKEVLKYFESQSIEVVLFENNSATPHIRIASRIDYWPSSLRFFDWATKKRGVGYQKLKKHVFEVITVPDNLPEIDQEMALSMDRDGKRDKGEILKQ